MTEIEDDLRAFVVDNFLFGREDGLKTDTSFLEAGMIDSTGVLQLVSFLQSRFGMCLYDHEIIPENLDSLRRLSEFVRKKLYTNEVEVGLCK